MYPSVVTSVVVVGSGIVGCTVAYELARCGATVQVIDPRELGQGATRASAGILAPYIEGHDDTLRDLGARSLGLYDDFIRRVFYDSGEGRELEYVRQGTFQMAFDDADVARLQGLSAALAAQGVESRWVEPRPGAFQDEPQANIAALGALLIPTHGRVGATYLTKAAAIAALRAGATFKNGVGAVRIMSRPGGVDVYCGDKTRLQADRVVLAAGSWCSQIAVEGADTVPVKPIRGQLILLKLQPKMISKVLWGPTGYYALQWRDGTVLIGATVEDAGFDESSTEQGVANMRGGAGQLVPLFGWAPVAKVLTGLRPRGPDDLPMIGRSTTVPGLIYATAHYRNGVLLAPLTAKLVADMVFDRPDDPALRALDPSRHGRM